MRGRDIGGGSKSSSIKSFNHSAENVAVPGHRRKGRKGVKGSDRNAIVAKQGWGGLGKKT